MKRAITLSLVALAGCDLGLGSTPRCAPGQHHVHDGCVVSTSTTIAIDGDASDWSAPELATIAVAPSCLAAPCDGLAIAELQVALVSDRLAIRARLADGAAPIRADDTAYVLDLATTRERPMYEVDELVASNATTTYSKNGYDVTAFSNPYDFAFTGDGFELAIPTAFLPFRGAAIATLSTRRGTTTVSDSAAAVVCWATNARLPDPCAAEVPR